MHHPVPMQAGCLPRFCNPPRTTPAFPTAAPAAIFAPMPTLKINATLAQFTNWERGGEVGIADVRQSILQKVFTGER